MRRNGSACSGSAAQSVWMDAVGERGAKAGHAETSVGQQTASLRLVRTPGPEAVDIRRALARTIIKLDQERFAMESLRRGIDFLRSRFSALNHSIPFEALHSSFDAAVHVLFEV